MHHREPGPADRLPAQCPARRFDSTQLGIAVKPDYPSGYLQQMTYASADAKSQDAVKAVFEKVKDTINAGSSYIRARGELIAARRTDFQTQIAELRKAIEANSPANRSLIKGGKTYDARESASAEVAQDAR